MHTMEIDSSFTKNGASDNCKRRKKQKAKGMEEEEEEEEYEKEKEAWLAAITSVFNRRFSSGCLYRPWAHTNSAWLRTV